MRFEEIAKQLSEEEGRHVSVASVRIMYYKALGKLRSQVNSDEEFRELLLSYLEEGHRSDPMVNEIIDSMVKYENE